MIAEGDTRLRERAYYIWEHHGRPYGRSVEHWLQAEREFAANEQMKTEPDAATATVRSPQKPRAEGVTRRATATMKNKSKRSKSMRPAVRRAVPLAD